MNTQTPDLHAVVERLEKVEGQSRALARQNAVLGRQNRTLKVAGAVALLLVGAVMFAGAAAPKPKTVEAEKFVLVDSEGRMRAELALSGTLGLILYDEEGKDRAGLRVWPDNSPSLQLKDKSGRIRVSLNMPDSDVPGLRITDKTGKNNAILSVHSDGSPSLFMSAGGKILFKAP